MESHAREQHRPESNHPEGLELVFVPVPGNLAEILGYDGPARYVGFYWSPAGDEVMYDDGRCSGTGEWQPFRLYVEHRNVASELAGYNLGSSDAEAEHRLVIDRRKRRAYIARVSAAAKFLATQHPPLPAVSVEDVREFAEEMRKAISEGLREAAAEVDMAEVERLMEEKHRSLERLVAELDTWPEPGPEEAEG